MHDRAPEKETMIPPPFSVSYQVLAKRKEKKKLS